MAARRFALKSPRPADSPPRFDRSPRANSLWAVEERLGAAERELRTQFVRIAQLQAELDLIVGARWHSPEGAEARPAVAPQSFPRASGIGDQPRETTLTRDLAGSGATITGVGIR